MSVKFVKSSVSAYGQAPSDEGRALRLVELCGRTAYKSEDKITADSAKKFVLMLKSRGHLSVLEHSNIVLKVQKNPAAQVPGGPGPFSYSEVAGGDAQTRLSPRFSRQLGLQISSWQAMSAPGSRPLRAWRSWRLIMIFLPGA